MDLVDIIYIILCTSCEDKQLLVYFLHFTGKLLILHNFFITFNKNKHRDFSVNLSNFFDLYPRVLKDSHFPFYPAVLVVFVPLHHVVQTEAERFTFTFYKEKEYAKKLYREV